MFYRIMNNVHTVLLSAAIVLSDKINSVTCASCWVLYIRISWFMFLQNVGTLVPHYTTEHPQRQNRIFFSLRRNFAVEWLGILLHIWEVLGSDLFSEICFPQRLLGCQ
jgi:hypothetical protein